MDNLLFISDYIPILSAIIPTITALIAIIIAIISIRLTNRIAINNIKPLISSYSFHNDNFCGVTIENFGMGTALITKIIIKKNNIKTVCFPKLFSFEDSTWSDYTNFIQEVYYYRPGQKKFLGKIDKENIKRNNMDYNEIKEKYEKEIKGIYIEIHYEYIFHNKQEPYTRDFL